MFFIGTELPKVTLEPNFYDFCFSDSIIMMSHVTTKLKPHRIDEEAMVNKIRVPFNDTVVSFNLSKREVSAISIIQCTCISVHVSVYTYQSICISVYVSVCICISAYVSRVYVSAYMYQCICIIVYVSVTVYICISVYVSLYMYQCICISVYVSEYVSVYMYQCICISVYVSEYVSVYMYHCICINVCINVYATPSKLCLDGYSSYFLRYVHSFLFVVLFDDMYIVVDSLS